MFSILRFALPCLLPAFLAGCATSMRMPSIPASGDSTRVGPINVRVVDLDARVSTVKPAPVVTIPRSLLGQGEGQYKVGPFDVLIVTVWEHPELTQPLGQYRNDLTAGQLVDADGTMYFPYTGRIKVAGLTATEIQKLITATLAKVLRDPQVDIKVAGYRSQRIQLSGEIRSPGIISIDDVPMTLSEALTRGGGLLPTSDASRVRLTRNGKVFELDVFALQKSGGPLDSIRLLAGDQIHVPNLDERTAYVLGEVARPTILRMTNARMSLLHGLSEAGGFNDLSVNAAGVYVVRAEDSSHVTVYRLDGRSPVALAWAGQFDLKPRDLVYVDQSGLSRWSKVFQLLVPMSSVLVNGATSTMDVQTIKTRPW